MAIYIRTYSDFSYELIFTEGKFKKKRLHLLVNPGSEVKLPSTDRDGQVEINPESITHILTMQTSIIDDDMLHSTIRLAEITNKPIITNKKTSLTLRKFGLSVKQLRLIGFEEEVVEGLSLDPVYQEEIAYHVEPSAILKPLDRIGNFGKKLTKSLTGNLLKGIIKEEKRDIKIDASNPLAVVVGVNRNQTILLPLDDRAVKNLKKIVEAIKPWLAVFPYVDISNTINISGSKKVIIMNKDYQSEEIIIVPQSSNPGIDHQTILAGLNAWFEIPY